MTAVASSGGKNVCIKMFAYNHNDLHRSMRLITSSLRQFGNKVSGPIPLPTKTKKFSVNASPHIDTASKEQLKIMEHSALIYISDSDPMGLQEISNIALEYGLEIKLDFFQ